MVVYVGIHKYMRILQFFFTCKYGLCLIIARCFGSFGFPTHNVTHRPMIAFIIITLYGMTNGTPRIAKLHN